MLRSRGCLLDTAGNRAEICHSGYERNMSDHPGRAALVKVLLALLGVVASPSPTLAQHTHTDHAAPDTSHSRAGPGTLLPAVMMSEMDMGAMAAHMETTPHRAPTLVDSIRASGIVTELRSAIARYRDVNAAEADGFRMFAPQLKNQRVYHFTKNLWALENQFRFNPGKPTSLLYRKDAAGNLVLVGAMYTAPKRYSPADLDKRIPISIAEWHKHVNWCLPPRKEDARWAEIRNGRPVFGPLGVATQAECNATGGRFMKEVFGWMVHANVFASDDPREIWGDDHMRGDEMMDHRQEVPRL
jgi:hypothetical protein